MKNIIYILLVFTTTISFGQNSLKFDPLSLIRDRGVTLAYEHHLSTKISVELIIGNTSGDALCFDFNKTSIRNCSKFEPHHSRAFTIAGGFKYNAFSKNMKHDFGIGVGYFYQRQYNFNDEYVNNFINYYSHSPSKTITKYCAILLIEYNYLIRKNIKVGISSAYPQESFLNISYTFNKKENNG